MSSSDIRKMLNLMEHITTQPIPMDGFSEGDPAAINQMIGLMDQLKDVVDGMSKLYESSDWLNNSQPASFENIIPMSLDEWSRAIEECNYDWKSLLDK